MVDVVRVQVQELRVAASKEVFLSYLPIAVWLGTHRGYLRLYGHFHVALEATPGNLGVGVDCWDWTFVILDWIKAR